MIESSGVVDALSKALVQAQADFPTVEKNAANPHFRQKYADLTAIVETVRPVLEKHGLALIQFPCTLGDQDGLTTRLVHTSGQFMQATTRIATAAKGPKPNAQEYGSGLTYARRYGIQSVLGLVADDDDGQGASQDRTRERADREATGSRAPDDAAAARSGHDVNPDSVPAASGPTGAQIKRLWAIARNNDVGAADIKDHIGVWGIDSTSKLSRVQYDSLVDWIESGKANQ